MNDPRQTPPFKTLGTHLKYLREHLDETVAEVSGAVEIDEEKLQRIEQGIERPTEEILMLLISHFNMQDGEAVQMWELAGYDRRVAPEIGMGLPDDLHSGKPVMMLLAMDMRTQYTDGVEVTVNKAGVVMNFTQAGGNAQKQPVARVGMSVEQAEAVVAVLQQTLLRARYHSPRRLPPPKPE